MDLVAELLEARRNRRKDAFKRWLLLAALYTGLRVCADLRWTEVPDPEHVLGLLLQHGVTGCLFACIALVGIESRAPARPRTLEAGDAVKVRSFAFHQGQPGTLFLSTLGLSFEPSDTKQEPLWTPRTNLEQIEIGRSGVPVLSPYALLTVRSTDWELPTFKIPKEVAPLWTRTLAAEGLLA